MNFDQETPSVNEFLRKLEMMMGFFFRCSGFMLPNKNHVSGNFNYEPAACACVFVCATLVSTC